MSIFATKSIEQIETEQAGHGEATLKRVLGPGQLITLGVGAIIGTGIFVLTGQAAAANAGPAFWAASAVRTKIPVPMIAPIPSMVSWKAPSER